VDLSTTNKFVYDSTNTAVTSVRYENGGDDVVLTFDAVSQDISYCPVIYTVHLIAIEDGNEVEKSWHRETNPITGDPYAFANVADSEFSANAQSSEYLTILAPADGNRGIVTISNTLAIDSFIGSYFLDIRAHH